MRTTSLMLGGSIVLAMLHASCAWSQSLSSSTEPVTVETPAPSTGVIDLLTDGVSRLLGLPENPPQDQALIETAATTRDAGRDYSIRTASIATESQTGSTVAGLVAPADQPAICLDIQPPPKVLQTQSKYRQDDSSRSTVDENALAARDKTVQPIRDAVRQVTNIAYAPSDNPAVLQARAECVLHNVDRWAHANSLTEMRSVDAYLSRDRWIAEVALAVQTAGKRVVISEERKALYSAWFGAVANDTIDAYSLRLGPKSRTNNHRYWAGLSVAAIGFLLDNDSYKSWGKTSFEIGACQVDNHGLLPAELARGEKALDYHVYALRPLAAIMKVSSDHGEPLQSRCLDGFRRLSEMTRDALDDPRQFERLAGLRQTTSAQENSYSAALKLDALSIF